MSNDAKQSTYPKCPGCGEELHEILHSLSEKLAWNPVENKWIQSDVYNADIACPNCNAEIDSEYLYSHSMSLYE